MVNYGIESTFSNDETVNPPPPPPPYPFSDNGHAPFSDEEENDLELNANGDEEKFEHTLSEHEFKAGPYEDYDTTDGDSTDIESEAEASTKKDGRHFSKKRNFLALLALVLVVISVALGVANKNAINERTDLKPSEANTAVTESIAAIVSPTETSPTETPAMEPPESVLMESNSTASSCMSIFDLACSTDGLETLCALISGACTTPGLETICNTVGELGEQGPFTVFAPSNSAFEMLSVNVQNRIQNPRVLNEILLYHVVEGKVLAADLVCDAEVTMANMGVTTTTCMDGGFYQSGPGNAMALPNILTTDVDACNGVVHVIDRVILPGAQNFPRPPWDDISQSEPMNDENSEEPINPDTPVENSDSKTPEDQSNIDADVGICQDEVSVAKECYTFGEPIEITYRSCSPGEENWLGVYRQGSSDSNGRMRQKAAYWELPCGGHDGSCANPMMSGNITMSPRVGPGMYQVYGIVDMGRPYQSNSSSQSFVVRRSCGESLRSHGALPSHR